MIRTLETFDFLEYAYEIDGSIVATGDAALVKLMSDPESSTLAVNGCLFLNVASFRYLDFESLPDCRCSVRLHGDGTVLSLHTSRGTGTGVTAGQLRLIQDSEFDLSSFVIADEEEDLE